MTEQLNAAPATPEDMPNRGAETLELPDPYMTAGLVEQLTGIKGERAGQLSAELNRIVQSSVDSRNTQSTEAFPDYRGFYEKLRWNTPNHGMRSWYQASLERQIHGIDPVMTVQNIKLIGRICNTQPLQVAVRHRSMWLSRTPETNLSKYEYITRLVGSFGCSASDEVHEIVRDNPSLMDLSRSALYFHARVAKDHPDTVQPGPGGSGIKLPLIHASPTSVVNRLGAASELKRYRPKQKDEKQSNFLRKVHSPPAQKEIGDQVLRAYFRWQPILNSSLFEYYPDLQKYNRHVHKLKTLPERLPAHLVITEATPWVTELGLPNWPLDIEALNQAAAKGSMPFRRLSNYAAFNAGIIEAREQFLHELGWSYTPHYMYGITERILKDKSKLPRPVAVLELLDILGKNTENTKGCLLAIGAFGIIRAKMIAERAIEINNSFPDDDILSRIPELLNEPVDKIRRFKKP